MMKEKNFLKSLMVMLALGTVSGSAFATEVALSGSNSSNNSLTQKAGQVGLPRSKTIVSSKNRNLKLVSPENLEENDPDFSDVYSLTLFDSKKVAVRKEGIESAYDYAFFSKEEFEEISEVVADFASKLTENVSDKNELGEAYTIALTNVFKVLKWLVYERGFNFFESKYKLKVIKTIISSLALTGVSVKKKSKEINTYINGEEVTVSSNKSFEFPTQKKDKKLSLSPALLVPFTYQEFVAAMSENSSYATYFVKQIATKMVAQQGNDKGNDKGKFVFDKDFLDFTEYFSDNTRHTRLSLVEKYESDVLGKYAEVVEDKGPTETFNVICRDILKFTKIGDMRYYDVNFKEKSINRSKVLELLKMLVKVKPEVFDLYFYLLRSAAKSKSGSSSEWDAKFERYVSWIKSLVIHEAEVTNFCDELVEKFSEYSDRFLSNTSKLILEFSEKGEGGKLKPNARFKMLLKDYVSLTNMPQRMPDLSEVFDDLVKSKSKSIYFNQMVNLRSALGRMKAQLTGKDEKGNAYKSEFVNKFKEDYKDHEKWMKKKNKLKNKSKKKNKDKKDK